MQMLLGIVGKIKGSKLFGMLSRFIGWMKRLGRKQKAELAATLPKEDILAMSKSERKQMGEVFDAKLPANDIAIIKTLQKYNSSFESIQNNLDYIEDEAQRNNVVNRAVSEWLKHLDETLKLEEYVFREMTILNKQGYAVAEQVKDKEYDLVFDVKGSTWIIRVAAKLIHNRCTAFIWMRNGKRVYKFYYPPLIHVFLLVAKHGKYMWDSFGRNYSTNPNHWIRGK